MIQDDLFSDISPAETAKYIEGNFYKSSFYATQRTQRIGDNEKFCELRAAFDGKKWVGGFLFFSTENQKLIMALELMCGEVKTTFEVGELWWPKEPITGNNINHVFAAAAYAANDVICSFLGLCSGMLSDKHYGLLIQISKFCQSQRLAI